MQKKREKEREGERGREIPWRITQCLGTPRSRVCKVSSYESADLFTMDSFGDQEPRGESARERMEELKWNDELRCALREQGCAIVRAAPGTTLDERAPEKLKTTPRKRYNGG